MFTTAKRKLLAKSLTKAAEYVFALVILGQFLSGKISFLAVILSILIYTLLVFTALIVVPDEKEDD
ncbi:hypothetical protein A2625_05910 [candidate division WOR-1 bacterium RIFCSPHIGHO2_01_FULL_53_15]|uniref:Uncharacterized protein n=1 Tax=candidate division WOR-1 bacterium RIFCSPHIGHO2_01_FULL_53_15 TaxID=1802564 RepID=A0A1F4Q136_UNCSA|nr:MAG: hypothetical protein A2625_05910 [candidate division WOR-1 bacterium RIFCSPHIGHO2_01_FULL_53_15]OGC13872.1 MAG: hypothetical protein A3D23_02310 [candidate division WOR-1 bacterium RIFCSPHIGHO2_02_FULL_53_26]